MFVGRQEDLALLTGLWDKRVASLVTCRGRRRVGKSTLIEEFAKRTAENFIVIEGMAPREGMSDRRQRRNFCERPFRFALRAAGDQTRRGMPDRPSRPDAAHGLCRRDQAPEGDRRGNHGRDGGEGQAAQGREGGVRPYRARVRRTTFSACRGRTRLRRACPRKPPVGVEDTADFFVSALYLT